MKPKTKTPHVWTRLGVMAFCTVALFALSASPVQAETVNCNSPNGDLQAAIDQAEAGATLDVNGSCDDGPYFIGKDLILQGVVPPGATLSATSGAVLTIGGGSVEITDLSIDAVGADSGIEVTNQGSAALNNVHVSGASDGVICGFSCFVRINSSKIEENGVGVNVFNGSGLLLVDTTVENNTFNGINVDRTSDGAIFSSVITENGGHGISVEWNATVQMSDTEITENGGDGVLSFQQSFVNFFDPPSTIEDNGGSDVRCDGGSGLFATATQISASGNISLGDCQNDFGAPIF